MKQCTKDKIITCCWCYCKTQNTFEKSFVNTILFIIISEVIPEALETTCGKCTPKQKQLIRKVIRAMMDRHLDSWNQLVDKYDKDKKYRDAFNKFLEENE